MSSGTRCGSGFIEDDVSEDSKAAYKPNVEVVRDKEDVVHRLVEDGLRVIESGSGRKSINRRQ